MNRALRIALLCVGAAAAGALALLGVSRRPAPDPRAAPVPPASALVPAPAPTAVGSAAPRDFRQDRDLTTSQEAFEAYAEGVGLMSRLPSQAASRFQKAASIDPAFAPAAFRLALVGTMLSRDKEARGAIQAALQHQDRLPEPYLSASAPLARFIDGAFDLATAALAGPLAAYRSDPHLHYIAGMINACSCDHFDPNGVIDHFEATLAADANYPVVRGLLTDAYELKGMNDWALTRAMEYQSRVPDSVQAIAGIGRARILRGEYGDAIEASDELIRMGADVLAEGLAPAFILSGHLDQVEALYDPEMERGNSPDGNVVTHLHAGINDLWSGRFEKALEHFERGPEFLPAAWQKSRSALFYLLTGRAQAARGRLRESEAALEQAQVVAGSQPVLEYALGAGLLKAGRAQDANRALNRLSQERNRSRPGWTEPWRRLMQGEIALAAGEASRALVETREAWNLERPLAIDCITGHTEAYFLDALGRAELAARRPADALQSFEEILSLGVRGLHQPEIVVLALFRSGAALEDLGRAREARDRYARFLSRWGDAEGVAEVAEAKKRLDAAVTR